MTALLVTALVMILVQPSWCDIGVRKSGPYNILMESITKCEDEGSKKIVFGTRISRTSDGKYIYNNPFYTKYDVDKDTKVNVELQSFSNGGYRPRYIHHTLKGCDEILKYTKDTWKRIRESAGAVAEECPIPAGNYSINGVDVNDIRINNIRVMMYNKYRAVVTFYQKREKVGCIQLYIELVPK